MWLKRRVYFVAIENKERKSFEAGAETAKWGV